MVLKRDHTHAGSWYLNNGPTLSAQLGEWLDQVPDNVPDVGELPPAGARTIIAPYVLLGNAESTALTLCTAMPVILIRDRQLHGHTGALMYPGRMSPNSNFYLLD